MKAYDDDIKLMPILWVDWTALCISLDSKWLHYKSVRKCAYDCIDKPKFMEHVTVVMNRLKRRQSVDLDAMNV